MSFSWPSVRNSALVSGKGKQKEARSVRRLLQLYGYMTNHTSPLCLHKIKSVFLRPRLRHDMEWTWEENYRWLFPCARFHYSVK